MAGSDSSLALGVLHPDVKEEFLWETLFGTTDTKGTQVDPFSDFVLLACPDLAQRQEASE